MDDSPQERRSSRRSQSGTSYKAKAFEKFKQLKKGVKNKYEVDEIDNVYEVVEEKQYVKEVLSRYDDDWIVDDDGSGYVEDGRDIFDDDLDLESIAQASGKKKGLKRKNKNLSENAGKGKLKEMISSMPTKKKVETKIDEDETLSEILGEINDEENTTMTFCKPKIKEYSNLAKKIAAKDYMNSLAQPSKKRAIERKFQIMKNKEKEELKEMKRLEVEKRDELVKKLDNEVEVTKVSLASSLNSSSNSIVSMSKSSISSPKKDKLTTTDNKSNNNSLVSSSEPSISSTKKIKLTSTNIESNNIEDKNTETNNTDITNIDLDKTFTSQSDVNDTNSNNELLSKDFDDDLDLTLVEEMETQLLKEGEKLGDDIQAEFENEWENLDNAAECSDQVDFDVSLDQNNVPLVDLGDKKVFRFWWWDAYEDPFRQRGSVFLFGKTYCEKSKKYVSCCVAVRNIERRIFVLPEPYELDNEGKPTDVPVTFKKMYEEFNNLVLKPLGVKIFKSKPTTKKYAFDDKIPVESEYMEVRYPATDKKISMAFLPKKPRTFSKVFGINTSFLETLFLDRKIRGPCWIDISNPVYVSNPVSWAKIEINCMKISDLSVSVLEKPLGPPPLVVAALNVKSYANRKSLCQEVVMISCLVQNRYAVDKQPPEPPFQQHFCMFTRPHDQILPLNINNITKNYKATKLQKLNNEKALLNVFVNKFADIDPDLIVGHDLQGYQIDVLAERLTQLNTLAFNKLGKLKRTETKGLEKSLFVGRLVCDLKISAKELIKSKSYDLDTLCQNVLKTKEDQRIDLEPDDIPKMFATQNDILKLVSFTMLDTKYILKMMYKLNVIPLALQITNIAGNVMSKTLMGGRSERNEFLLLHAFADKGYILPDKEYTKREKSQGAKKKAAYSGGLVLDPKVGFYDNLILLMDFNSLYPSIIQEYNICFTTLPIADSEDLPDLPDSSLPPGILPTEIRKLVESRRQVKALMKNPNLSNELRTQYDIRQMALKLTANSMYGCLGFSNSRFYARNLAALITQKGREILTNTKCMIEKMNYDVVYGDTDSLMINTKILDYEQVFKIGLKIKQEVNKLYKQVELDIDGVFKYLLLVKKKKYAAVLLNKDKNGALVTNKEYKGLDIVRRDWSQLACEAGKYVLEQILCDQTLDDKIENIVEYLAAISDDIRKNRIPTPLLVITKQLTKDPYSYTDRASLPHVLVAIRYNKLYGGHLRSGDTVPYVICEENSMASAMQRAYHVDELKNNPHLKIDVNYYLEQQIVPVVSRIVEPMEGIDTFRLYECMGLDAKRLKQKQKVISEIATGENIRKPEYKFRNVDKFKFICFDCQKENIVIAPLIDNVPFLFNKCANVECQSRPIMYLPDIQTQLIVSIQSYISKYYEQTLICEDPSCTIRLTNIVPLKLIEKYPKCECKEGVMFKEYNESQLYSQLQFFKYLFDLSKLDKRIQHLDYDIEMAYQQLLETVMGYLTRSDYGTIKLKIMFKFLDYKSSVF